MLLLGPETITDAGFESAGPTSSLVGRVLCDPDRFQTSQAGAGIESWRTQLPGIDHHTNAVDRQTGFSDRAGKHDFFPAGRGRFDRHVLIGLWQVSVERSDLHVRAEMGIEQAPFDAANFRHARQKDELTARVLSQRAPNTLDDGRLETACQRTVQIARFDGKHSAFAGNHGRTTEQIAHRPAVQCCGHHEQPKFRTDEPLRFKCKRQADIGLKATLVELVEQNRPVSLQLRIADQQSGQHPFGDDFQPGVRAHFGVEPHSIADRFSDRLVQCCGQPMGSGSGRQPPWLEHEELLPRQPGRIQQGQRHTGGLTSPRRGSQQSVASLRQCLSQLREHIFNWQTVHARVRHDATVAEATTRSHHPRVPSI